MSQTKWPEVELGEVCEINMGQAPKGDTYNQDAIGFPLVAGAGDFGSDFPNVSKYTSACKVKLCQSGDIILGIRASIGKKVRADKTYCLGRGVAGLRNGDELEDRFLWNWLSYVVPLLTSKGRGATFLQINRKDISATRIPLPPIEEQRRIAKILDAADALRTKRRASIAKLESLTQAIFIEMFGDQILRGDMVPLGELGRFVGGGTPKKAIPEYFKGHICWATAKDMKSNFIDDTVDHITDEAVENSATKLVPTYSVLVVVKSKILARKLPVAINRVSLCFGQDLKAFVPESPNRTPFVAESLRVRGRRLLKQARGANTEGLNLTHLRSFLVPKATKNQQILFEKKWDFNQCSIMNTQQQLAQLDTLFASLQQRAFRGDL